MNKSNSIAAPKVKKIRTNAKKQTSNLIEHTYRVIPIDPAAHLYQVNLLVMHPAIDGQRLQLPAWIPGSYLIREFARHIVELNASCQGKALQVSKQDKHTWQIEPCDGPLQVSYKIYAWDLSVRGAYLDEGHGFFNGSSLFLSVVDQVDLPCRVEICRPQGQHYAGWRVATALIEDGAARYDFGWYRAATYDELIDHPVAMGEFLLETFKVCGVMHEIAITGVVPNLDKERLLADLEKICAEHIRLFDPQRAKAPFARYLFLVTVVSDGYGGLEHRASTALLCSRNDLPVRGAKEQGAAYRQFLGLCSHEYFHAWHIKRIKPAAFVPYDLTREAYTRLLWLFEGFTSYYDDLMLLRSHVITLDEYLGLIAKTITDVLRVPGRFQQTLNESSFDAWIKYYRPDENTPNTVVSYYAKGALMALALDLTIRLATRERKSLDDVMRALWKQFGESFYQGKPIGIAEDQVLSLFNEACGLDLEAWLNKALDSTHDLPLEELFKEFGFVLEAQPNATGPGLDARIVASHIGVILTQVYTGGVAQLAGLAAGDTIVAIDNLRVQAHPGQTNPLATLLSRYQDGDHITVHAFRRDELRAFSVQLAPPESRYTVLAASGKRQSIGTWPAAIKA